MILGIDHVQMAMPPGREAEAERFYQDLLGLVRVPKPAHLAARGGCWFEGDGVHIHLGVEQDFRPSLKAHVALLVSDLSAVVDRLTAGGAVLSDDEPLDGYLRTYVADPFGNRIELMQRRPSAG